ncbi:hypothetical protein [Achromobacter marplatensis]|uniref:hypothetical protein n=1 Tax=Achromobacter marplatensis TaxID=470868 RepID=UPI0039F708F4
MNLRAVKLTRLIAVRLLWYVGIAVIAVMALLAGYHMLSDLDLAQCGLLLVLVAGDLWLVRWEVAQFFSFAPVRPGQQSA